MVKNIYNSNTKGYKTITYYNLIVSKLQPLLQYFCYSAQNIDSFRIVYS